MKTINSVNKCDKGPDSSSLRGYIKISRIDHWFKNIFMFPGIVFAFFHEPGAFSSNSLSTIIVGLLSTCFLASSNYVLNEIQDAVFDSHHPSKKYRPIPAGLVNIKVAYFEWLGLILIGILLATLVNLAFLITAVFFIIMAWLYNLKPFRFKDRPYFDVLSEAINNPIRLLLGWFTVVPDLFPSVSLLLAYWFIGAFFMATKRLAELRFINNSQLASIYRKSFAYYSENTLIISMFYYITSFGLFLGLFIIRYHLELILATPLIAGFVSYYVEIGLKENSTAQNPEKLYKEKGLILLNILSVIVFFILLFTDIPVLYDIFNIKQPSISPLWQF